MAFLEEEIARFEQVLAEAQPTSEAYGQAIVNLRELYTTRELFQQKNENKLVRFVKGVVGNQALVQGVTTIGGILLVTYWERKDAITSRAFSFIRTR